VFSLYEHREADGPDVFRHAFRSGCSPDWIKRKNPDAPAVKREAEEKPSQGPTLRM